MGVVSIGEFKELWEWMGLLAMESGLKGGFRLMVFLGILKIRERMGA